MDSCFLRHGIEPALSADATAMAPGDMFSQMRVAFACGRGEKQAADPTDCEPTLHAREILACATINGARVNPDQIRRASFSRRRHWRSR